MLEKLFKATHRVFKWADPVIARIGYKRIDRYIRKPEDWAKGLVFGCRMCGQCILHSTGMTCPMTCPKLLRNGPCGGVRPGGYCEVYPERRCIWTDAYERSRKMPIYGQGILDVQPPVDWRLEGTSAWINMLIRAGQRARSTEA